MAMQLRNSAILYGSGQAGSPHHPLVTAAAEHLPPEAAADPLVAAARALAAIDAQAHAAQEISRRSTTLPHLVEEGNAAAATLLGACLARLGPLPRRMPVDVGPQSAPPLASLAAADALPDDTGGALVPPLAMAAGDLDALAVRSLLAVLDWGCMVLADPLAWHALEALWGLDAAAATPAAGAAARVGSAAAAAPAFSGSSSSSRPLSAGARSLLGHSRAWRGHAAAFLANFHDTISTLCMLSYVSTGEALRAAIDIGNVRWHVSQHMSAGRPRVPVVPPEHIFVTPLREPECGTVRALVCTKHVIVVETAEGEAAKTGVEGEGAVPAAVGREGRDASRAGGGASGAGGDAFTAAVGGEAQHAGAGTGTAVAAGQRQGDRFGTGWQQGIALPDAAAAVVGAGDASIGHAAQRLSGGASEQPDEREKEEQQKGAQAQGRRSRQPTQPTMITSPMQPGVPAISAVTVACGDRSGAAAVSAGTAAATAFHASTQTLGASPRGPSKPAQAPAHPVHPSAAPISHHLGSSSSSSTAPRARSRYEEPRPPLLGRGYDCMLDVGPGALPAGWRWVPSDVLVFFTGTDTGAVWWGTNLSTGREALAAPRNAEWARLLLPGANSAWSLLPGCSAAAACTGAADVAAGSAGAGTGARVGMAAGRGGAAAAVAGAGHGATAAGTAEAAAAREGRGGDAAAGPTAAAVPAAAAAPACAYSLTPAQPAPASGTPGDVGTASDGYHAPAAVPACDPAYTAAAVLAALEGPGLVRPAAGGGRRLPEGAWSATAAPPAPPSAWAALSIASVLSLHPLSLRRRSAAARVAAAAADAHEEASAASQLATAPDAAVAAGPAAASPAMAVCPSAPAAAAAAAATHHSASDLVSLSNQQQQHPQAVPLRSTTLTSGSVVQQPQQQPQQRPQQRQPQPHAHAGFARLFREIWPELKAALSYRGGWGHFTSESEVWLLGHSMGGALATLAAPAILSLIPRPQDRPGVLVTTLASPRVFDAAAARAFAGLHEINLSRFAVAGDGVPGLPPRLLGFRHVGAATVLRPPPSECGARGWKTLVASGFRPAAARRHSANCYRRALRRPGPAKYMWQPQLQAPSHASDHADTAVAPAGSGSSDSGSAAGSPRGAVSLGAGAGSGAAIDHSPAYVSAVNGDFGYGGGSGDTAGGMPGGGFVDLPFDAPMPVT